MPAFCRLVFFIPLFSSEEPFQRLDCWPPASHRAPLVCKCSLLCECPNAAEVLAESSSTLATKEAVWSKYAGNCRSEEHTSELQSHHDLVCCLLLEKKNRTGPRCARRCCSRPARIASCRPGCRSWCTGIHRTCRRTTPRRCRSRRCSSCPPPLGTPE